MSSLKPVQIANSKTFKILKAPNMRSLGLGGKIGKTLNT